MKKFSMIYLALGIVISQYAMAEWQFQGGGRILETHQSASPGTLGGLLDQPIRIQTPRHLGASAYAMASSASAAVNSTFNIFGQHSFYIKNTTPVAQRYKYYYQLCGDSTKCFYYNGTIELNPGSIGQNSATSYVTLQFSTPGTYRSEAKTQVVGEQTAYTVDQGFISIFKP